MGEAFARRALEKGHHVVVWNRTPDRCGPVVAAGAHRAASPGEAAAEADAVLVVLADDAAVLDVCLGAAGVLASLGPSAVLANISTVAPSTIRQLADAGPADRVLDSPVMGSPEMIAAGFGSFLIGGSLSAITAVEPLWTDLGSGYTHCGPSGTGATMKIVQNMLLITGVAALAEGIATARENGLSEELIRSVMSRQWRRESRQQGQVGEFARRRTPRLVLAGARPQGHSPGHGSGQPGRAFLPGAAPPPNLS